MMMHSPFSVQILGSIRAPSFLPPAVFESHWLWWILGLLVGLGLFWLYRHGENKSAQTYRLVGLAIVGLLVLWIITALTFTTPKERLEAVHRDVLAAASRHDIPRILSHLSDNVRIPVLSILSLDAKTGPEIESRLKTYGITDNTVLNLQQEIQQDSSITRITVRTDGEFGSIVTAWRLEWADIPGKNWQIVTADLVETQGNPFSGVIPK